MKQVKVIKNSMVVQTVNFQDEQRMNDWIEMLKTTFAWGRPERWVDEFQLASQGEDVSKAIDEQLIGGPENEHKLYKFPAEYVIEIEDITAKVAQDNTNAQSLKYLAETDWYVIRFLESGVAVPSEVTSQRAAARAAIVR